MARMIPDDIDFSAYMRDTECKAKVKPASVFAEELAGEFASDEDPVGSRMSSTRLRSAIAFRRFEVTCWAGFNGHRKSLLTGQVALDLCASNEPTLMVSLEMTPSKTLARMCRQAAAAAFPSADQQTRFMRWTDGRLWIFDHVGLLLPAQCIAVCNYFSSEHGGRHVFIDSAMKVCQSEESLDEQKRLVTDLCDVAKETGLHIHLVAHCRKPAGSDGESRPPTKYDIRGSAAISDQSHNVITVWQNRAKRAEAGKAYTAPELLTQPDAIVSIEKQRNGSVEGKFGLWFDERTMRFCDNALSPVEPYRMECVTARGGAL